MGGPGFFELFFALFLTISGGNAGNDLLDMIPTDSYWRVKAVTVTVAQLQADITPPPKPTEDYSAIVKQLESLRNRDAAKKKLEEAGAAALPALQVGAKSEDPEAAAMAKELLEKLAVTGRTRDVRRLMAIRTLGERKEKDALPLLKSLLDSKELFVAEYAQRAIAQIEGTVYKAPDHRPDLAPDIDLFPSSSGIVGQVTSLGIKGFNMETAAAQLLDMAQNAPPPGGAGPGGGGGGAGAGNRKLPEKGELADRLTKELIPFAERTGNLRIDGLSFAVSKDVGGASNWFILSLRGTYDVQAISAFAKSTIGQNATAAKIGSIDTLQLDREATFLFPSSHQALLVVVDAPRTDPNTILKPLVAAIEKGKGDLSDNKVLSDLVNTVDKSGPAWVVGIPSMTMRQEPMFTPFDTMTLTAAEAGEDIRLTLKAAGGTAMQIGAASDDFDKIRAMMLQEIQRAAARNNQIQPFIDLIVSAKIGIDDKGATATAVVTRNLPKAIVGIFLQEFGRFVLPDIQPQQPAAVPMRLAPVAADFDGPIIIRD